MFRCLNYLKRAEVQAFFLLLLINTVYFMFGDVSRHSGFYANIILNLGIFFFSNYLSIKGKLSEQEVVITFFFLLIATSYRFFIEREELLYEFNGRERTINLSYAFVIFMPFLFYVKNKVISGILILFTLYMVLLGAKRGAILIFVISALYYVYYTFIKNEKKIKYSHVLIAIAVIVVAFFLTKDVYLESEYLQSRLEMTVEGNANGRNYIYKAIWNKWITENNIPNFLFGYGFCSSLDIAGNRAHNDWLEMMATAGLGGVIIYITYWSLLLRVKRAIIDPLDKRCLNLILLILILKSFFSMSYCSVENMAIFLLLGYVLGKNNESKRIKFNFS